MRERLFRIGLFCLGLLLIPGGFLRAANVSSFSDRMSRQGTSAASNHDIRTTFTTAISAAGDTITLAFASGFDLTSLTAADISLSHGVTTGEETAETISSAAAAGVWGAAISGQVVTLSPPTDAAVGEIPATQKIIIRIGTLVVGGSHQITNPSTAGGYVIAIGGAFGGSSGLRVPIGGSSQTTAVSATVAAPPVASGGSGGTGGSGGGGGVGGPTPPPSTPSVPRLAISGIEVSSVTENTATILWRTNQIASGWVDYGLVSSAFSARGATDGAGVFQTVTIRGLSPATAYHFQIRAVGSTQEALSAEARFTTALHSTVPPPVPAPTPTPAPPSTVPTPPPATGPAAPTPSPTPSGTGTAPAATGSGSSAPATAPAASGTTAPAAGAGSGSGGSSTPTAPGSSPSPTGLPIIPTTPTDSGTGTAPATDFIPLIPPESSEPSIPVAAASGTSGMSSSTQAATHLFKNPFNKIKAEASVLANALAVARSMGENVQALVETIRTPETEAIAQVAAPVAVIAAAATVTAAASAASVFNYLFLLMTQPLLLLNRRKREKWGMVYNALSKQPIDLAVVRLVQAASGVVLQTRITDAQGRFAFLAPPGSYRLQVVKASFVYPSALLKDDKIDLDFIDLYHGEVIQVAQTTSITPNIPIDPVEKTETPKQVIRKQWLRRAQHVLSLGSLAISLVALLIHPTWLMAGLSVGQVAMYALFRRLSLPAKPKSWGIVYDQSSRQRVGRAVVRIFDKRFHKLLETQVTDKDGKYAFFAGKNVYFVTADHPNYERYTSPEIDVQKENLAVIDQPLALAPKGAAPSTSSAS